MINEQFSKIMARNANVQPYRIFVLFLLLVSLNSFAQMTVERGEDFLDLNKPERLEWLKDAGFGMFIHFSFDSQLGIVIGHSMTGASPDYLNRFVNDLPKTFNISKIVWVEIYIIP